MLKIKESDLKPGWNESGRPAILDPVMLEENIMKLESNPGMSLGRDAVRELVQTAKSKTMQKARLVPLNVSVSGRTMKNNMALLACHSKATSSKNVIAKTNRWHIADHSLNNAVTFLMIIAANNYIIGKECPIERRNKMSDGAKLLLDRVSKTNDGIPVCPIKPQYCFSTDDTVQYVFEGQSRQWSTDYFLSSKKSLAEKGMRSQYQTVHSTPHMHGQQMKYTFTFSGAGQCAPIFIMATGLTASHPHGMLVVKIPGLSIGGAVNPSNKNIGYLCFYTK